MAGNTNYYQVLDLAGVQQLWDTCKATFVRTVNGNGIDANGNVSISVAGDFQVNGQSVLVNGVANINTKGTYNASTNKIATMNDIYPVNSIYMSVDSTSPASLFGGTWERIKDKFLLASGDTYTAGNTGGSATHKHNLSSDGYAWIGLHSDGRITTRETSVGTGNNWNSNYIVNANGTGGSGTVTESVGAGLGGTTNNQTILPPYLVVNIWKRTA